jgi:hypothetical protein
MITNNEQLKQWEDERAVKLMCGTMKRTKPVIYIETTPLSSRISEAIRVYATKFDSHAVLQKSRPGVDMVSCSSNKQTRKRSHGWYRQFDKGSKKRNLRG